MQDKKKQKLIRALQDGKIRDEQTLAVFELVNDLEEKVDVLEENVSNAIKSVKDSEVSLDKVLESVKGQPGEPGAKPVAGIDYPIPENGKDYILTENDKTEIAKKIKVPIVEKVIERIIDPTPPDYDTIINESVKKTQEILTPLVPKIEDIEKGIPKLGEPIRDSLELLQEDERLDIKAIKGLDGELNRFRLTLPKPTAGNSRGIQTYVNGGKKGLIQYIDFVQGSNVTISPQLTNGLLTLTISSTGGSGFSTLAATETPDGVKTVFTFATASAQPSFIIVDNVWMRATTAMGTVNWTWNGGTKKATLSVPAQDEILGVV